MNNLGIFQSHKKAMPTPMTRGEWCEYMGWNFPGDQVASDEGYMLESLNGKPNDSRHENFITWTPKEQFDEDFTKYAGIDFQKYKSDLKEIITAQEGSFIDGIDGGYNRGLLNGLILAQSVLTGKDPIYHQKHKNEKPENLTIGETFSFGEAVRMAKLGYKVAREGWNGTGMFAYIVPERGLVPCEVNKHIEIGLVGCDDCAVIAREHWELFTAQKDIASWVPSGSDSLAMDWALIK